MTSNEQLEIDILIALYRLYEANQNQLFDSNLLPDETIYSNGSKYDRLEHLAKVLEERNFVNRDQEAVSLSERGRNHINELNIITTNTEEIILVRLNDKKNDPNATETVLNWELELSEYDCKIALKRCTHHSFDRRNNYGLLFG